MIRLENVCNAGPNNETVVLAHLNGAGLALKSYDCHASFACHACHEVLDGRTMSNYENEWLELIHLRGVIKTQERWIAKGLM
jgi:uncharacterized CHY-type Zn-finger protein